MRRFCLILAAAVLSLSSPVAAQTAGSPATSASSKGDALKLQLANRIITLMQGEELTTLMSQMIESYMNEDLEGLSGQEASDTRTAMSEVVRRFMPRMFEAMAPVYADIFTVEELRGLVAFYESDLGQAFINKSYAAMPRLQEATQAALPSMMSDMAVVMCDQLKCTAEELREMKAGMREAMGD